MSAASQLSGTAGPTLATERLILRLPGPQDIPAITRFFATERSRWIGGPKNGPDAFRALATVLGHWGLRGFGMFAIEQKGAEAACGFAGPWFPEGWPEHELGWNLWSENDEGRGIAHEAVTAARRWAYDSLGWRTAVSYIHPENARSLALGHRLGAFDDTEASRPFAEYPQTRIFRHPAPEDCP